MRSSAACVIAVSRSLKASFQRLRTARTWPRRNQAFQPWGSRVMASLSSLSASTQSPSCAAASRRQRADPGRPAGCARPATEPNLRRKCRSIQTSHHASFSRRPFVRSSDRPPGPGETDGRQEPDEGRIRAHRVDGRGRACRWTGPLPAPSAKVSSPVRGLNVMLRIEPCVLPCCQPAHRSTCSRP